MTATTGRESVANFLQDVVGREQSLTPKCGRLREIHARIGKEVEDAKKELHATVQSEWPTLQKQYTTTIDLSNRLRAIQGSVGELEDALDGGDSALRPRLKASLAAHAELSSKHQASETLVDLLASLHAIQQATTNIQTLLDQGRLDGAVPAIQQAEKLLNEDSAKWKRQSKPYQALREQCRRLRTLTQERLQTAFEGCVAIEASPRASLTISSSTISEPQSANYTISLQAILDALSSLEPLEKRFSRVTKAILKFLVEPLIISGASVLASAGSDQQSQTITLNDYPTANLASTLHSLHTLLQAIRKYFLTPSTTLEHQNLFFALLIPPIQQLLVSHVLKTSIPQSAHPASLDTFQKICETVSSFEQQELSTQEAGIEPVLQDWAANAGSHWSRSVLERCFAQLRVEIASPQYWDKTESVDWIDDAGEDDRLWQGSSNGSFEKAKVLAPAPTKRDPPTTNVSTHGPSQHKEEEEMDLQPEEDAWGLDITPDQSPAVPSTSRLAPVHGNTVEASPDPNADDAWGLGEDDDEEDATSMPEDATFVHAVSNGQTSRPNMNEEEAGEGEEEAGWSFDDDGDKEIGGTTNHPPNRRTHSKNVSLEDWDAWSKPEQEQVARPIGKPTKVISGKMGGRKPLPQLQEKSTSSEKDSQAVPSPPPPALQEPFVPVAKAEPPKKVVEKMLVSTRSRRVVDIASELLEASLAVSDSSSQPSMFASSSSRLSQAFDDTFDLYRAIMPVAHKDLLSSVPSIGMQFANDCIWISRTAGKVCRDSIGKGKGRQDSFDDTRRTLERMRRFGEAIMEDQLELQRLPLIECLDEADGLRNTDDPQAFQRCQRSIRQIVSTLDRLSHAWKPVMLKRTFYESLGILVNAALLRVLVDIENQEDISEEASLRLNDLCKMLHELENLFMDGEESTVALHVPVWLKFKFLSELLEASMADIMFLFNEGHLVDFSSTELTKLIYALFAESQLRQKNLETIARGR